MSEQKKCLDWVPCERLWIACETLLSTNWEGLFSSFRVKYREDRFSYMASSYLTAAGA